MMARQTITGGGGIGLHLVSAGPADGPPILFVHGFLFSHHAWARQFEGSLLRNFRLHALDMRGHGMSDKPTRINSYTDEDLWAEDMAAAIAACERPPVVVVWSYPGLMLGAYLRRHGDAALAGVVLVAALTAIGQRIPPTEPDTDKPLFSADLDTALPAMRRFVQASVNAPLSETDLSRFTAESARVPAEARLGMTMRRDDYLPDYAKLTKPALVVYGAEDRLVAREEAEGAAKAIPGARLTLLDDIGHMPFLEAAGVFDADLMAFARSAQEINA